MTGVQTCALPISSHCSEGRRLLARLAYGRDVRMWRWRGTVAKRESVPKVPYAGKNHGDAMFISGGDHLVVTHRAARLIVAVSKRETRRNITGYTLENGKTVNVISEGRLVNIAAGDGHPAEIMDMSFAVQALSVLYIKENHNKLDNRVMDVSDEIDRKIAFRKLEAWGITIDTLTKEQESYLNSWKV